MKVDHQLIKGCKRNDRQAQETLYRLLFPPAFKVAMRYSSCEDDAMDILNQAFFKALTKLETFKGNGDNFYGWLKRILVNQALDNMKKISFQQAFVPIEEAETELTYDDVRARYAHEDIIQLIQKLPATSACVFNLYAIDGYSHKDIAEKLGITEDNSRYHLHSARKQLKTWIFKMEKL